MTYNLSRTILVLSVVGLSACSMFTRRNGASVEDESKTAATPLDMPAKTAATDETPAAAQSGPQVTLVKKDGTVLNADGSPLTTTKPATTNEAQQGPGHMPITHQMTASETYKQTTEEIKETVAANNPAMPAHDAAKTWSYSGETGPEHWASMNADNSLCASGKMQSPIDLKWHKPVKAAALSTSYKNSKAFVTDNGHAIQVAFDMGGTLKINGDSYDLLQMHFHTPSEHTLSGKQFPMEAHFIHKNADGKIVVLAALFKEGKDNAMLAKVWNAIPNPPAPASASDLQISAKDFMPPMKTYYEYMGSETAPPCTENVRWLVFNSPMNVSKGQLEALQHFHKDNNRPVQALNDRKVVNH